MRCPVIGIPSGILLSSDPLSAVPERCSVPKDYVDAIRKSGARPLIIPAGEALGFSEELFDVVDEDDIPVRTATRGEVHSQNLLHRAVHVFVLNKNGDLWLQKRSQLKDMNPGVWDSSVSGHLNAGEDYLQAAIRELGEEIGIEGSSQDDLTHALSVKPSGQTGWEHVRLFVMKHSGNVSFPTAEIESMMPFPIEEIRAWSGKKPDDFSPAFLLLFRAFLDSPEI